MLIRHSNLLNAVTLENAYGAARTCKVMSADSELAELDLVYVVGAAEADNVLSIKIESSNQDEPTVWHQVTNAVASGADITFTQGTGKFTASAGTHYLSVMVKDLASRWLQLSFLETGVAANKGTITASVTLANHNF